MRTSLLLLLLVAAASCSTDILNPNDISIRLIPDRLSLLIGERTELQVQEGNNDVPSRVVEWVSFGPAIADVDGEGEVIGVGPGTTAIAARHRGAEAIVNVTIQELVLAGVSAGRLHSCGWEAGGTAYCWGDNNHGQLGSAAGNRICGEGPCHFRPAAVEGGHAFSDLATGTSHTCGITTTASAYCWGANDHGQLGTGETASGATLEPRPVTGTSIFDLIEAGSDHTCALDPDGAAYCWGLNDDGQLGDGTRQSRNEPVPVAGQLRFATLAAGVRHTCGLTVSGTVYCWGSNAQRQLGNGTRQSRTTPGRIADDRPMMAIAAGDRHSCAIGADSRAYCWGANGDGQVGDGTSNTRDRPTAVSGHLPFTAIAAGGTHSCGVSVGGPTFCWGDNRYRQLGDGSDDQSGSRVPRQHDSPTMYATLYGGWLHTCGNTSDGRTHCWGYNGAGQLGRPDRTAACLSEPVQRCSRSPVPILGSR